MTGRTFAAIACLAFAAVGVPAEAARDGQALFARCTACHLADGAGVPGSFPPLRDQIVAFARTRPGRGYLVSVVTKGLAGPISLRGTKYDGFMPAQSLDDADAAAVLNHVVNAIAAARPAVPAFTADEVAAIRRKLQTAAAQDSLGLRPEAAARDRR